MAGQRGGGSGSCRLRGLWGQTTSGSVKAPGTNHFCMAPMPGVQHVYRVQAISAEGRSQRTKYVNVAP